MFTKTINPTDDTTLHSRVKVMVYPFAPNNPYQSLLYEALVKNGLAEVRSLNMPITPAEFVFQIFIITFHLVVNRIHGYRLIHIHWLYQLGFPGKPIWPWLSYSITTIQIHIFLFFARVLGYKIIWTVHDIVPHHKLSLDDLALTRGLIKRANELIVLSPATLAQMHTLGITYNKRKVSIVPHGNYINYYSNTISKLDARQKLGISKDAFVYLFFGTILPYKNVTGMLQAFENIVIQYPEAVLIIAGANAIPQIVGKLHSAEEKLDKSLKLFLHFIPDEDVQIYYNAADIAVSPYLKITNSGVALLSASFGKPVVAPLIGAFKDLPLKSGLFYAPGSHAELEESMRNALIHKNSLNKMSIAAQQYAESLSWNIIAEQTYDVYLKAFYQN